MKKRLKKYISAFLCVVVLLGSAPMSGIADINLPDGFFSNTLKTIAGWFDGLHLDVAVSTFGSTTISGTCGTTVRWKLNTETGVLTISGKGKITRTPYLSPSRSNKIKTVIIEEGVTSIIKLAFHDCNNLTSVIIPDSVTSIGDSAFRACGSLKSVTIPDSVTEIGSIAFGSCTGLKELTIPCSARINNDSFYECTNIEKVTLTQGTEPMIGPFLFCSYEYTPWYISRENLKEVIIEDGVSKISYSAFNNCTALESVTIGNSVTSIDDFAFSGCKSLTSLTIGNSVTSIGNYAFYNCTDLESATIGNSVTSIGNFAFYTCFSLISVTIPDSVTSIGNFAFYACFSLISVTIPDGVTSIGNHAFNHCTGLTSITVDKDNKIYDSRNNCNAIIETSTNTLILGCQNTTIPDSITSICGDAFYNCNGLTSITIPDGVTSIGNYAFYNCSGLISITVDENNTVYDSRNNCNAIIETSTNTLIQGCQNTTIPDSVTSIGNYAFYNCTGCSSITIPNSVTSIGNNAFDGVNNVSYSAKMKAEGSPWGAKAANGYIEDGIVYNNSSKTSLLGCSSAKTGSVTIPDSVKSIGEYAFYNCTGLTSVTIPDSVTSIGSYAFKDCTGLTSITIPDSVTSIDSYAFYGCTGLTSVNITDISKWCSIAFAEYASNPLCYAHNLYLNGELVTDLVIPDSVTSIGSYALYNCTGLTSVTIPDSVTSIGGYAFNNCTGLESVIIGNGVTSIGNYAFYYCTGINELTMPCSAKMYNNSFYYCTNIEKVTLTEGTGIMTSYSSYSDDSTNTYYQYTPWYVSGKKLKNLIFEDGVNDISNYAFYNCTGLTSVTIPDSVTSIGNYAFFNCSSLTSVTIPDSVTSIGKCAFSYCTSLTSITIPTSVTSIGEKAFYGVNNIIYSQSWYENTMHSTGSPWGAKLVDAYVEGNLYYYDSSKELLLGCSPVATGTVTIPDTVEEVGDNCFSGCDNITQLNFDSADIVFSETMLQDCDNLITINSSNTSDGITLTSSETQNAGILFCNRDKQDDYTVGNGISVICENAFANCTNVLVTIPDTVELKRIGKSAFDNSEYYNNPENWSNGVLTIGRYIVASQGEDIGSTYTIGNAIILIADCAFKGCTALKSFFGKSALKYIGAHAFGGCSSLSSSNVNLEESTSIISIGENIFSSDDAIEEERETVYCGNTLVSVSEDEESFTIKSGTTCIAAGAFENCLKLQSIVIPSTVKIIDDNTFSGCINLKSVTISEGVTKIGKYAFKGCVSLKNVIIPSTVTEIGDLAFNGCFGLQSFNVSSENSAFCSDEYGILYDYDKYSLIQCPASCNHSEEILEINSSYICDLAFERCKGFEQININSDDVCFGNRNPFACCSAKYGQSNYLISYGVLVSVEDCENFDSGILKNVEEIGGYAFYKKTELKSITLPYGILRIDDYAFSGCTGLTKIVIPNSVESIGDSAFEDCINLKEVVFIGDNGTANKENTHLQSIGKYAFCNCPCNAEGGLCNEKNLKKAEISDFAFHNHNEWNDWTVLLFPTYETNGQKERCCSECKKTETVVFPMLEKNIIPDCLEIYNSGIVCGFSADDDSIISKIKESKDVVCDSEKIVTGTVIKITSNNEEISYTAVIFGDVNSDGIYDGTDSIIVNCLANGMLKRDQVGEAVYMAADCNHDGVIDEKDVALLEYAGVILSSVDQSKSAEELQNDSSYQEYINLIDQNIEENTTGEADTPADEPVDKQFSRTFFQKIFAFVKYIFVMIVTIF